MGKSSVTEINGHVVKSNTKDFLLTSRSDVDKLPKMGIEGTLDLDEPDINEPVACGSSALVKEGGTIYTFILFPDNEWTEL